MELGEGVGAKEEWLEDEKARRKRNKDDYEDKNKEDGRKHNRNDSRK